MKSLPADELKAAAGDVPVTVIGDAIAPAKVDQAIATGYHAGVEL